MANELQVVGFGQRMSSREIAELTEKEHKHVMRDIRNLESQGAITERNFALSAYIDASGKSNPEYLLDFDATMTFLIKYGMTYDAAKKTLSKHGFKEKAMENLPMNWNNFGRTMSSREIAELTEKEHFNVCRDIRTLVNQGAFNGFKFELVDYTDAKGEKRPEYLLDFDATMTLLTGYNAVLRARVIKRWRELEQKEALPIEQAKTPSIASEFDALRRIAITAGLEGNAATISADNAMRRMYGVSPLRILQIELKSENQEQMFTPTQIGEILGFEGRKGARRVNSLLAELDYQERIGDSWVVTEEGKPYAVILDTGKKRNSGTMVQQIKWKESVIPKIEKLLDEDDD